jgi:hypothetical protein
LRRSPVGNDDEWALCQVCGEDVARHHEKGLILTCCRCHAVRGGRPAKWHRDCVELVAQGKNTRPWMPADKTWKGGFVEAGNRTQSVKTRKRGNPAWTAAKLAKALPPA